MFLINIDEFFDGLVGFIFSIIGFILLIILGLTTNYVPVGIGLGFAVAGLFTGLSLIGRGIEYIISKNKNEKIWGIIILIIVGLLLIMGFVDPIYSEGLKIKYSRFVGMFASPFIPFAIMSIIINIKEDGFEEGYWQFLMKCMSLLAYIAIGITITGIAYFADMNKVLNFLNKNFTYEDKRQLDRRESRYNSKDFEVIFKKMLEKDKETADKENKEYIKLEDYYLHKHKKLYAGYRVEDFQLSSGEHTYVIVIEDQATYDSNNKYPRYYPVVNFETLEVIEFRKNSAGIEDSSLVEKLDRIENESKPDADDYMLYTLEKLKNRGAEINCSTIYEEAKYLKMSKKMTCHNFEQLEDGNYRLYISIDNGILSRPSKEEVIIKPDYTFEVSSAY